MALEGNELEAAQEDRERIDLHGVVKPAAADPPAPPVSSRREKALRTIRDRARKREIDARLARARGDRLPTTFEAIHKEFMRLAKPARKGRLAWHARTPESLLSTIEYNACNETELRVLGILLLYCFRHTGISAPGHKQIAKIMCLEDVEHAWRKEHPEKTNEPSPIEQRIQRAISGLIAKGLVFRKSSGCKGHSAEFLIARNRDHIAFFKSMNGSHAANTIDKAKGIHAMNPISPREQE